MSLRNSNLLVLILVCTISVAAQRADYTRFVDPFIGTNGTEANAWQYSFASQHDIAGLIKLQDGRANFAKMLDRFFSAKRDVVESDEHLKYLGQEGLIGQYSHVNEPSHHIAYLYKYTVAGWKTDELIREITTQFYSTKPDGITGNDDCGQMSAGMCSRFSDFIRFTQATANSYSARRRFVRRRYALQTERCSRSRARISRPRTST